NPLGLSRTTLRRAEELLEALETLRSKTGSSILGWPMNNPQGADPASGGSVYVTITATVLEAYLSAQRMGLRIKSLEYLHVTIARLVRYQTKTTYGEPVEFVVSGGRAGSDEAGASRSVTGRP